MITVNVTWGDGPDIIVQFKEPIILMEKPDKSKTKHGIVYHANLDLSEKQARNLMNDLAKALNMIWDLEKGITKGK